MEQLLQALIVINLSTLVAVATIGVRIIRSFSRIEREHEILWQDYENRMRQYQHAKQMGEIG